MSTRYGRSPGGYAWAFLDPIGYVAMMSALFGVVARLPATGESFPFFFATGYIAYSMYNGTAAYLSSSVAANKNLMQYPKVSPIDPFIGRAVLQAVTSTVVGIVVLWGTRLGEKHAHALIWTALFASILLAWMLAAGVALINIVMFERFPLYEKMYGILTRPLFFLSGVFYVPGQLPHPFREILLSNPVTHIIILFREGFYGETVADGLDVSFLSWSASITLFAGFLIFTLWPVGRRRID